MEFHQIKASAGSGKTYTLTGKFLTLLANAPRDSWTNPPRGCLCPNADTEKYDWTEILAITFTNKAAAEMRDRILSRLKKYALGGEDVDNWKKNWTPEMAKKAVEYIFRRYGALNIRTIDSLLHLMLRSSALDFDLTPDFDVVFDDKEITAPIFEDFTEEALENTKFRQIILDTCSLLVPQEKGFLPSENLEKKVCNIVNLLLKENTISQSIFATMEEMTCLQMNIIQSLNEMSDQLKNSLNTKNVSFDKNLNKWLSHIPISLEDNIPEIKRTTLNEYYTGASKDIKLPEEEKLYRTILSCIHHLNLLASARKYQPLADLAFLILNKMEEYEQRHGILASVQIPALAARSTKGEYGVSPLFCNMGSRIRHMLIDEFQDTSLEQWTAIFPFARESLSTGGSFTMVGDVKQAIYAWRGGKSDLFDKVIEDPELRDIANAKQDVLRDNRRSLKSIVTWNNAFFSSLADEDFSSTLLKMTIDSEYVTEQKKDELLKYMTELEKNELLKNESLSLSSIFKDAKQNTQYCTAGGTVLIHSIRKENDDIPKRVTILLKNLETTYEFKKICILTRTNTQAENIAKRCLENGIDVIMQGSLLLSEQSLISSLCALLRFIDNPEDDKSFLQILFQSGLLPFRADMPVPFPKKDSSTSILEWLSRDSKKRGVSRRFREDFPKAWALLFQPLLNDASLLTPYDIVMEIVRHWKIIERHPEFEAFIRRFLEIIFLAEEQGKTDLAGFLEYWDQKGIQEKAPLPDKMNAVQIMTIHKAKGLEFPVVILPYMNFISESNEKEPILWEFGGKKYILPLSKHMGKQFLKSKLDDILESMNLLYVAMTRPSQELHCFIPKDPEFPFEKLLNTMLCKLQEINHDNDDFDKQDDFLCWGNRSNEHIQFFKDIQENLNKSSDKNISSTDDKKEIDHDNYDIKVTKEEMKIRPEEKNIAENHDEELSSPTDGDLAQSDKSFDGSWQPMGWLPTLHIYHSALEDWTFTSRRRGTFIHHCLEYLQITGGDPKCLKNDVERAVLRGLDTFPLPIPDHRKATEDARTCLLWFAEQRETAHLLAYGIPERRLMNSSGKQFRVDLLSDDGKKITALEYKTGTNEALPEPKHVEQLSNYLHLLKETSALPVSGLLIYLDKRRIFSMDWENGETVVLDEKGNRIIPINWEDDHA